MTSPTFEPVELPSRYAKAYVAIATALVAGLYAGLTDGLTLAEGLGVAVLGLSAILVELVPLASAGVARYSKAIIAVAAAVLQAIIPLVANGGEVGTSGWMLVFLAALGAVSVGITPNAPPAVSTLAYRSVGAAVSMPGGSTVANRSGEPEFLYDPNRARPSGRPAGAPDEL